MEDRPAPVAPPTYDWHCASSTEGPPRSVSVHRTSGEPGGGEVVAVFYSCTGEDPERRAEALARQLSAESAGGEALRDLAGRAAFDACMSYLPSSSAMRRVRWDHLASDVQDRWREIAAAVRGVAPVADLDACRSMLRRAGLIAEESARRKTDPGAGEPPWTTLSVGGDQKGHDGYAGFSATFVFDGRGALVNIVAEE